MFKAKSKTLSDIDTAKKLEKKHQKEEKLSAIDCKTDADCPEVNVKNARAAQIRKSGFQTMSPLLHQHQ